MMSASGPSRSGDAPALSPPITPTTPTESSLVTAQTQADLVSKVEYFRYILSLKKNLEYVVFVGNDPVALATWTQQLNPQIEGMILTEYPLPPIPEHVTPRQLDQYEKDLKVFLHNYIADQDYTDIPISSHLLSFRETKEATPQMHILLMKGHRMRDSFFRDWIADVRKGNPQPRGTNYGVRELRSRLSTISEEDLLTSSESAALPSGKETTSDEGDHADRAMACDKVYRLVALPRSDTGSSKDSSDLDYETEASDKMDDGVFDEEQASGAR